LKYSFKIFYFVFSTGRPKYESITPSSSPYSPSSFSLTTFPFCLRRLWCSKFKRLLCYKLIFIVVIIVLKIYLCASSILVNLISSAQLVYNVPWLRRSPIAKVVSVRSPIHPPWICRTGAGTLKFVHPRRQAHETRLASIPEPDRHVTHAKRVGRQIITNASPERRRQRQ